MILFHGRKKGRIKSFTDQQQHCPACKAFDLKVTVYREYYHVYLIPIMPLGDKTASIRCRSCGEPLRSEPREKEYTQATRTPFYLYALPIIVAAVTAIAIAVNLYTQKQKAAYVANPEVNDVYLLSHNNFSTYSFYKLVGIKKDSLTVISSRYEYLDQPSSMTDKDYFVKEDSAVLLKKDIQRMLDSAIIIAVERNYDSATGFKRVQ